VACAETRHDLPAQLFGVERAALGRAVEKRRREFVTGRACAREALTRLGAPAVAIPAGPHGEPRWPAGVVGSITHCAGFRACAVAWAASALTVGIDAEPNLPLVPGVFEEVAFGGERELVAPGDVDTGRLLFCAKEAVYKAWFPLAGRWLGFEDVRVSLGSAAGTFRAELGVAGPRVGGVTVTGFDGRWGVSGGIVCAVIVEPAAPAA
jgi:4'-phosphopantetheinyl transferase EntD